MADQTQIIIRNQANAMLNLEYEINRLRAALMFYGSATTIGDWQEMGTNDNFGDRARAELVVPSYSRQVQKPEPSIVP